LPVQRDNCQYPVGALPFLPQSPSLSMLGGRYLIGLIAGHGSFQRLPKISPLGGSGSGSPGANLHSLSTYLGNYQCEWTSAHHGAHAASHAGADFTHPNSHVLFCGSVTVWALWEAPDCLD
jgi:hypothetical protein